MVDRSELVSMENITSPATITGGGDEKMKIMHNGMQSNLNGSCRCQDGSFDVSTSSIICWKIFSVVISYYYNLPWGKMCVVRDMGIMFRNNVNSQNLEAWIGLLEGIGRYVESQVK